MMANFIIIIITVINTLYIKQFIIIIIEFIKY